MLLGSQQYGADPRIAPARAVLDSGERDERGRVPKVKRLALKGAVALAAAGLFADAIARRRSMRATHRPGLLMVQIDGLSLPALRAAMRAGHAPFLASRLAQESCLATWHTMIPPTTPASQAGMLHGRNDDIPGFRWYEKSERRIYVANHPADAADVLRRLSDGRGLLAGGGVSIGNLLTGDARRSYLTMATVAAEPRAPGTLIRLRTFFVSPLNGVRIVSGMVSQFIRELYQANRQARQRVEPRMHRGLDSALERALLNSLVRNLSTELAIAEMRSGTPAIYLDYTGYDAIAHHAGPERPESLHAVHGIDRAIERLMASTATAKRPYRLVVLSDHGQSLGVPFAEHYGQRLDEYVVTAMGQGAESAYSEEDEHAHALPVILREILGTVGLGAIADHGGELLRSLSDRRNARLHKEASEPALVVCASGNLAHLYFTKGAGRLTTLEIEDLYPGMLEHVTSHPSVGIALVRDGDGHPVVLSGEGRRDLDSGAVDGLDPLRSYGTRAAASLRRLHRFTNVGDIVVISRVDPETALVTSYEPLVGCHGGLGGPQEEPFILYPRDWKLQREVLEGAPAIYETLRAWLRLLGR